MSFLHYLDFNHGPLIKPKSIGVSDDSKIFIMAGGAAVGKSTVIENLKLKGIVYDIDKIKTDILENPEILDFIKDEVKYDFSSTDLSNPDDLELLNTVVNVYYDLPKVLKRNIYSEINTFSDKKPNIIFDVTLYSLKQLQNIVSEVLELGYKYENINVIQVTAPLEVALERNAKRERRLSDEALIRVHSDVNDTLSKIKKNPQRYFGGSFKIIDNS